MFLESVMLNEDNLLALPLLVNIYKMTRGEKGRRSALFVICTLDTCATTFGVCYPEQVTFRKGFHNKSF